MRILVALGGNALLHRGERPDADLQQINVLTAAKAIAQLAAEHEVVLTHGNGPQVGMLALESAADPALTRPYPLDILGAQTQGMIGGRGEIHQQRPRPAPSTVDENAEVPQLLGNLLGSRDQPRDDAKRMSVTKAVPMARPPTRLRSPSATRIR